MSACIFRYAVAVTLVAIGIAVPLRGLALPLGQVTEIARIEPPRESQVQIKDLVPRSGLEDGVSHLANIRITVSTVDNVSQLDVVPVVNDAPPFGGRLGVTDPHPKLLSTFTKKVLRPKRVLIDLYKRLCDAVVRDLLRIPEHSDLPGSETELTADP